MIAMIIFTTGTFPLDGTERPPTFVPPPEGAIPADEFGSMIKIGEAIFTDTRAHAGAFVGNSLKCSNCHLDAGRLANSAPLAQAYVAYPASGPRTTKCTRSRSGCRIVFALA